MADIVDTATRSRMMSGIRSGDTKPELMIRKGLFQHGFRYRLHVKELPGTPDLVFAKYNAVIFVHGCFWHGHNCHLFKWPSSNKEFWKRKIKRNKVKDNESLALLRNQGLRVLSIWECALKGKKKRSLDEVLSKSTKWLLGKVGTLTIKGRG